MKPVWIIDDDRSIRWVFEKALARENLPHRIFDTAEAALRALDRETPGAVVSDIRMPGMSGLDFMEHLKQLQPRLPIIIMTAYSDLDSAVSAFQGGAFEYLPKPFDVNHALELIHRALEEGARGDELPGLDAGLAGQAMLGQAPSMQDVFRAIVDHVQANGQPPALHGQGDLARHPGAQGDAALAVQGLGGVARDVEHGLDELFRIPFQNRQADVVVAFEAQPGELRLE